MDFNKIMMKYQNVNFAMKQRNRHRSMPCEVANAQISLPENIFNKLISHYICQYRVEERIPLKQQENGLV
jgi:hypothetical protein